MSDLCPPAANAISEKLGGFSCGHLFSVTFRNPAHLTSQTMPVLEALMILGAVAAIVFAISRLRRTGDPTHLGLAIAGIIYLLITEIPLYFPTKLGLDGQLGTVFVHNVFTVDFLADRLPLYIVAVYIALPMLAYEIVRVLGIFDRVGSSRPWVDASVAALCVGVVHSALYEIFDQVGPQLRWWAWNTANHNNHPFFGDVPMGSAVLFALVAPVGLTLMIRVAMKPGLQPLQLLWRAALVGALVPLVMVIGSLPTKVVGDSITGQAVVLSIEFAAAWAIAVPVLRRAARSRNLVSGPSWYVGLFAPVYILVLAELWFAASDHSFPGWNITFVVVCFIGSVLVVAAAGRATRTTAAAESAAREQSNRESGARALAARSTMANQTQDLGRVTT